MRGRGVRRTEKTLSSLDGVVPYPGRGLRHHTRVQSDPRTTYRFTYLGLTPATVADGLSFCALSGTGQTPSAPQAQLVEGVIPFCGSTKRERDGPLRPAPTIARFHRQNRDTHPPR